MNLKLIENKLPKEFYSILQNQFTSLTPPQEKAVNLGLLEGENIMVCAPTASGKTMIAEMAMIKNILDKGGKAIYTVPLKALATEKFNDFKERYEKLGIKVAVSIGDLDSSDEYLGKYDIIICSNEKLDSLIRHHINWLAEVSVVVIDEVHLINEASRGPTLEVILTMLKGLLKAQFIALSATVGNPEEMAKWLDAKLVKDNWRSVKLYEGINLNNQIDFFGEKDDFSVTSFEKDPVIDLAIDTIKKGKQALVFVNTKRSAESIAENLSKAYAKLENSQEELKTESKKVLTALSSPTKQCKRLSYCIENSVAFHHSGLSSKQRSIVESCFKDKKVKIICCTTTLALGLDFPTDRVIVRDLKRFTGHSTSWIPVLEMKQFIGRAGRPRYSTEGEAICIAKSEGEKDEILDRYINGEVEDVYSKLALEPVLRMYILSLISISFTKDREALRKFFEKTFWAFQYGDIDKIESKIDRILDTLKKYGFVEEKDSKLYPTKIGMRVSQLYIDPLTADYLIKCIEQASIEINLGRKLTDIGVTQAISDTLEMRPLIRLKQSEYEEYQEELIKHEEDLYSKPEFMDEYFFDSFKTGLMLYDWLNEKSEEYLLERYNVRPGELMGKLNNSDWLIYSIEQLAILLGKKELLTPLSKLRIRLKYGAKEELLNLLRFKDIGRIRSRMLYAAGIKNTSDIKSASTEKLSLVLKSKEIAKKLKQQVEVKPSL